LLGFWSLFYELTKIHLWYLQSIGWVCVVLWTVVLAVAFLMLIAWRQPEDDATQRTSSFRGWAFLMNAVVACVVTAVTLTGTYRFQSPILGYVQRAVEAIRSVRWGESTSSLRQWITDVQPPRESRLSSLANGKTGEQASPMNTEPTNATKQSSMPQVGAEPDGSGRPEHVAEATADGESRRGSEQAEEPASEQSPPAPDPPAEQSGFAVSPEAQVGALAAPIQLSPASGTEFSHFPRTTTVKWTVVRGAASYTVETDCFKCCHREHWCTDVGRAWRSYSDLHDTQFSFNFVGAQPGRWRVWAVDGFGRAGPRSPWWEFNYAR
jgi:hypothetical protein